MLPAAPHCHTYPWHMLQGWYSLLLRSGDGTAGQRRAAKIIINRVYTNNDTAGRRRAVYASNNTAGCGASAAGPGVARCTPTTTQPGVTPRMSTTIRLGVAPCAPTPYIWLVGWSKNGLFPETAVLEYARPSQTYSPILYFDARRSKQQHLNQHTDRLSHVGGRSARHWNLADDSEG